jgi:hypothetical protein
VNGKAFRLATATIAIETVEGKGTAMLIPAGAIVRVSGEASDDARMIHVLWQARRVTIFKLDLRERGLKVRTAAAG